MPVESGGGVALSEGLGEQFGRDAVQRFLLNGLQPLQLVEDMSVEVERGPGHSTTIIAQEDTGGVPPLTGSSRYAM